MIFKRTHRGTRRIREFFAFLPVTIEAETRWLEKVKVLEEYYSHCLGWVKIGFIAKRGD